MLWETSLEGVAVKGYPKIMCSAHFLYFLGYSRSVNELTFGKTCIITVTVHATITFTSWHWKRMWSISPSFHPWALQCEVRRTAALFVWVPTSFDFWQPACGYLTGDRMWRECNKLSADSTSEDSLFHGGCSRDKPSNQQCAAASQRRAEPKGDNVSSPLWCDSKLVPSESHWDDWRTQCPRCPQSVQVAKAQSRTKWPYWRHLEQDPSCGCWSRLLAAPGHQKINCLPQFCHWFQETFWLLPWTSYGRRPWQLWGFGVKEDRCWCISLNVTCSLL